MRSWFPPAVALLSLTAISLFSLPAAQAQINAPPSSVTSPGFGGRPVNGTAPSVTSVGPRGYAPNVYAPPSSGPRNGEVHHRRHRDNDYYGPYLYAYPVPYAVDNSAADDTNANSDDSNDQGGPTVFDRRGSGERSYVPPIEDVPAPHATQADNATSEPEPPLPPTLLVFKDGHQLEIGNYAIVGVTLFDLTPGHPRRIALTDLDLDATRKANDNRGVVFEVPPSVQANQS